MPQLVPDSSAMLCLVYHLKRSWSRSCCADSPAGSAQGGVHFISLSQQGWLCSMVSSRNLLWLVNEAGETCGINREKPFSNVPPLLGSPVLMSAL